MINAGIQEPLIDPKIDPYAFWKISSDSVLPNRHNPKILNSIDQTDVPISDGLLCRLNKNLDKYNQQKNKLNNQYDVIYLVKQNIILPDKQSKAQHESNDLSGDVTNMVYYHKSSDKQSNSTSTSLRL